ncbi:hypothetical protein [Rugosimonospora africana]|uniref:Uncharacterized protein n=1 Tax=Rugosimonospora africana TaxID=556532 RepID=A0A8J3QPJ1_9ACTN|nr:hypothetical protein [Rugosimonospora africana]GIH14176.1 hypothetical protein Raf01_23480 [Rugosimonospora africana]
MSQTSVTDSAPPTEPRPEPQAEPESPAEPVVAGRRGLSGRGLAAFARHEWTLVATSSLVLAVVMTWPTLRYPTRTLPSDVWDPSLQSWEMSWSAWAILHHPAQLWQGNAFYTEKYSFAYSDSLLGYLPAGLIGSGPTAAVLRYNILFVLAFALACFGAYILARQLGSNIPGAAVAGTAFAFAPWRWTQVSHLHVLSTGGIALSLAMLARGHGYSLRGGYRPDRVRPRWALAGWLVAAWQVTLGFGIGLPFAYVLALLVIVAIVWWLVRRPAFSRRLLRVDVIGAIVFAAAGAAMAYPYFQVLRTYPYAQRALTEILFYSPGFLGFVTAPSNEWLWGPHQQRAQIDMIPQGGWEGLMLPGYTLYALAAIGLVYSAWSWRRRVLLLIGLLGFGTLAMGLRAPVSSFYYKMYDYLPGWSGIRTPGRLIVWVTLVLVLLAAGATTVLTERVRTWSGRLRRGSLRSLVTVSLAVPCLFVLVEGVQTTAFPTVPRAPASFASLPGPLLVLPTNWKDDELAMLWSTANFVPLVNGSSGFFPQGFLHTEEVVKTFPDATSVQYLRGLGVRTVLVLRQPNAMRFDGPPEDAGIPVHALTGSIDGLGISRDEQPDAVIYHLDPD